jgi:hypothetical protein
MIEGIDGQGYNFQYGELSINKNIESRISEWKGIVRSGTIMIVLILNGGGLSELFKPKIISWKLMKNAIEEDNNIKSIYKATEESGNLHIKGKNIQKDGVIEFDEVVSINGILKYINRNHFIKECYRQDKFGKSIEQYKIGKNESLTIIINPNKIPLDTNFPQKKKSWKI